MHVQTILVDTLWLHNVLEIILLLVEFKFLWKNGIPVKIKAHFPPTPPSITTIAPFQEGARDYAFYVRVYKEEKIKLLPFYMTDFLFTEHLKKIKKSYEKWYT